MHYTRNKRELQSNMNKPVRVIGLTGGIAAGKTVATSALRDMGYAVIDADEVSRALFAAGTVGEKSIIALFPQASENGKLDRKLLRRIISNDAKAQQKLNALTHPAIIAEIKKQISVAVPPVILSAPLLFESALCSLCDVTVAVYCPRGIRVQRLTARDGIAEADAKAMIDAQIPDTERCTIADYIIPSDRDQAEFVAEVVELIKEIVSKKS